jgi:hypothetical protein
MIPKDNDGIDWKGNRWIKGNGTIQVTARRIDRINDEETDCVIDRSAQRGMRMDISATKEKEVDSMRKCGKERGRGRGKERGRGRERGPPGPPAA